MTLYLTQELAKKLDQLLMGPQWGFKTEQLMELAGLSCAKAVYRHYPKKTHKNVLVIVGPGSDGLVLSRHLHHFGYDVTIYCPKRKNLDHLWIQCTTLDIPIVDCNPLNDPHHFNVICDAIFGYSFSGAIRDPYDQILLQLSKTPTPIVSIDIPSGWIVDSNTNHNNPNLINPEMLISLAYPKLCSLEFKGKYHYIGGRFVPPKLTHSLGLKPLSYNDDQLIFLHNKI